MSPAALGDRVTFTRKLTRVTREVDRDRDGFTTSGIYREWVVAEHPQAEQGIIVGKRKLANGFRVWESYSDDVYSGDAGSYVFDPAEYIDAYLVAYHLNRSPVLVRPEDISPLGKVCPFDCDGCHGEGCPCDRMGCDGDDE